MVRTPSFPVPSGRSSGPSAGLGYLGIEVIAGQSAATSVCAVSPLKILVPRPRGRAVWAYLSSLGGGLVAGDEISLTVTLGEQARCFLSTQASTKIYRNPAGRPCSHHLRAQLASGSLLALVPDPVQAFLGSLYRQRQEFSLAPDSGLVLVDWVCSGRAARGERWAFQQYSSRNEIFIGDSRVMLDSLFLDPADGPLDGPYRMGRFNCLAVIVLIGSALRQATTRLLQEISQLPLPLRSRKFSLSPSEGERAGVRGRTDADALHELGAKERPLTPALSPYEVPMHRDFSPRENGRPDAWAADVEALHEPRCESGPGLEMASSPQPSPPKEERENRRTPAGEGFMVPTHARERKKAFHGHGQASPIFRPNLPISASPIHDGVLVRLAGERVEDVASAVRHHLAFLTDFLHDDPWSRKF